MTKLSVLVYIGSRHYNYIKIDALFKLNNEVWIGISNSSEYTLGNDTAVLCVCVCAKRGNENTGHYRTVFTEFMFTRKASTVNKN